MKVVLQKYWRIGTVALIIIGLLLLALSGYLSPVMRVVMNPILSAQTWLATRYLAVYSMLSSPTDVTSLRQENERLKAENARLSSQLIELQEQQKDFSTLYSLLKVARTRPDSKYLAAMIIGRDPSPFMRYVYINQGSDVGLRRGMPVITEQGLAGRIVAVSSDAAQVQLITDASSAVNVRLPNSKVDAVMSGSVTGEITLEMIPQGVAIQPDELILTSGLGGAYPANLLAGQVVSVRRLETALFQSASVQPAVNFNDLRWVMVVTDFKPIDLSPLEQGIQP